MMTFYWPRNASLGTILAGLVFVPGTAKAYPIDCAILLCLSGGWPSSAECTAARAIFIRRITPIPIEPPLQIWRCPMSSAGLSREDELPIRRFARAMEDLGLEAGPQTVTASGDSAVAAAFAESVATIEDQVPGFDGGLVSVDYGDATPPADVDISGPDFDFIRSIKVYDIEWVEWNHENSKGENDCKRARQRVRLGIYDDQGSYAWRNVPVTEALAQSWLGFTTRVDHDCSYAGAFRGVGVEWRDYEGNHGFEVVNY